MRFSGDIISIVSCASRYLFRGFAGAVLVLSLGYASDSGGATESQDRTIIPFQQKLRYYLNEKTQDVIEELVAKETQAVELLQNIHKELYSRGKESVIDDEPGFKLIYHSRDSLTSEYDRELTRLIAIYDDLQRLIKIAEYSGDMETLFSVRDSKNHLFSVIDNRELFKKGIYDTKQVGIMIHDYASELDSLLNIYDSLQHIQALADYRMDQETLRAIHEQKVEILKIMSQWSAVGPFSETDYTDFKNELSRIQSVIRDARFLQENHFGKEADSAQVLQKELMEQLNKNVMDLMNQTRFSMTSDPPVTDFINAWKTERLADMQARLAEYQLLWTNLLNSADGKEMKRMLHSETENALLNYSKGKYRVAEYQLSDLLQHYQNEYPNLTPVLFYIGECRYQRHAFDQARDIYLSIVQDSTTSSYKAESYMRLMQYEEKYGTLENFQKYYQDLLIIKNVTSGEMIPYAHYLAVKKYFANGHYSESQTIIQKITPTSIFYDPAQLFRGVILTNLGEYDKAQNIFEHIAQEKSYPWTEAATAFNRNTALLRLGLLYYQKADYSQAASILEQISQGFKNFDEVLIAQAWTYYQLGNYRLAIEKSNELLNRYTGSNYTYEAMVLSAQCSQLLQKSQSAMDSYYYVVHSSNMMKANRQFEGEKQDVRNQVRELNKIEEQALEKRQVDLYSQVSMIQNELNEFLLRVQKKDDVGNQLYQDYYEQRVDIMDYVFRLDKIVQLARECGDEGVLRRSDDLRGRLSKLLDTFQSDHYVSSPAFFFDYPLVAKESSLLYKEQNFSSALYDLNLEKKRIENSINTIDQYRSNAEESPLGTWMDLQVMEFDIRNLRDRISRYQKALIDAPADPHQTQLSLWNDWSGYGIAQLVYNERKAKFDEINQYANRIVVIDEFLTQQRSIMEQQLAEYEEELKKLQERLIFRRMQLQQLEHEKYIREYYFDQKDQESKTPEDRLLESKTP